MDIGTWQQSLFLGNHVADPYLFSVFLKSVDLSVQPDHIQKKPG
jgi:hypothetical protein